jgi:hypothetical protein
MKFAFSVPTGSRIAQAKQQYKAVVTQFGYRQNKKLPSLKPGGLYKCKCQTEGRFRRGLSVTRF